MLATVLITVFVGIVTAVGAFLLPPALAETPNAPLPSDSTITLGPSAPDGEVRFVSLAVSAGWTRIGTGPFLPTDRTTLVSPDGLYRVDLELVKTSPQRDGKETVPADAVRGVQSRLDRADWSAETMSSGNSVRYTTVPGAGDAVTVAIVDPPAAATGPGPGEASSASVRLVLVATAPSSEATRYRTVTADLVASAVFSSDEPSPDPTRGANR